MVSSLGIQEAHVPCWFPSSFLVHAQQIGLLGRKEGSSLPLCCYLLLWPMPGSVAMPGLYSGYPFVLFLEEFRQCEGTLHNLNDRRCCGCPALWHSFFPEENWDACNWNWPSVDPGRCKSLILAVWQARADCVTVCAEHCQFNGSEAPWLEVKCYENFPKHRSTAVSAPAHKTGHWISKKDF